MPKTLQTVTLGCSKNKVDTERLLARVQDNFEIIPEGVGGKVDYLLVNSCGFIGDAKEESIQAILAAAQRKTRGEVGKLLVFGCLSQRYMDSLPSLIPEVDGWYGARDLTPVVEALGCGGGSRSWSERYGSYESYAYLKISEGCDRRCAYCAIPLIRGAHRSVPIETLCEEARALSAKGAKELILIAQDSTYYGLDLYGKRALGELLQRLSEIGGIHWLRIHYSYPENFPEDVLDVMAANPKVCRYIDIPLQHISDKVLSMMRRGSTSEGIRTLVRRMREKVPGLALRTTMIVGHPGEGKRDFKELLDFVREARFERLGAFIYSKEEGTYAAEKYKNSIPEREKQERLATLMDLQRSISLECNLARVGSELKVLVDAFHDGVYVCRSEFESPEVDGEILVKPELSKMSAVDPLSLVGQFFKVRITAADDYDLIGEFVGTR